MSFDPEEEIDEENLTTLFNDLTYDGFNLDKMRENVYYENGNELKELSEIHTNVIIGLTALAKAGNNTAKLTKKVKNAKTGNIVKTKLKKMNVKRKAKSSDGITLPRLAIAFMPTYILLRKKFKKSLQKQGGGSIAVEYADISLCGVPEIWKKKGYQDFYHSFSKLIKEKEDDEDKDDDESEDEDDDEDEPKKKKRKLNKTKDKKKAKKEKEEKIKNLEWVDVAKTGYDNDYDVIKELTVKCVSKRPNEITVDTIKESINEIIMICADVEIKDGNYVYPDEEEEEEQKEEDKKKKKVTRSRKATGKGKAAGTDDGDTHMEEEDGQVEE